MTDRDDRKNISYHILPTASNLLGLCFVILSFIKISKVARETLIDEFIGVVIVFFLFSSVLSYISIRSKTRSEMYEKYADTIFFIGLGLLTLIALVIIFEIV
jgi:hypothetical protein